MKKIILKTSLFFAALFTASSLQAQALLGEWADNFDNSGSIMTVDEAGNSYIAGYTLTKVSPAGVKLWTKPLSGVIKAIACDRKGALYVTGTTDDNVPRTMFAAKYTTDGTFVWSNDVNKLISTYDMEGSSIAVDTANDYIYVAGSLTKSSIYEGTYFPENKNIFLARFYADGTNGALTKEFGSYNTDYASRIAVDKAGDILVSGRYTTYVVTEFVTTYFDSFNVGNASGTGYLMKLSSSLSVKWFQKNDHSSQTNGTSIDNIIVDNNNDIYVSGNYLESNGIKDGVLTYFSNHYLEKMTPEGNSTWLLEGFAAGSYNNSLLINNEGNLLWTGTYSGSQEYADHRQIDGYFLSDGTTMYLAQISATTGHLITVQTELDYDYINSESLGTATPYGIQMDTAGNVYMLFKAETMAPYTFHVNVGGENVNGGIAIVKYGKPAPNISISYNNNDVANNNTFYVGQVWCGKGVASRTFKIKNTGNRILTLNNSNAFTISGTDISDFQLDTTGIKKTFNPGDSATFIIKYNPLDTNSYESALLTIISNDSDENPYNINLWGKAIKFPQSTPNWTQTNFAVKYGDADIQLIDTISTEGFKWTFSISDTNVATIVNGNVLHFKNAGSTSLIASNPGDISYFAYSPARNILVSKAQLTVTVDSKTKIKGQVNPALTYSFSGFLFNDDASVISGSVTLSCSATTSSNAGVYGISVSNVTLSSDNYSFKWVTGNLTIYNAPNMVVKRNGTIITNNGTTGFGTVATSLLYTYKIFNTGGGPLTLSTTSSNNSQFVVSPQDFNTSLAVGDSISFTIEFIPNAVGTQNGQISIVNGDPSRNPFNIKTVGIGDATVSVAINTSEEIKLFPNPASAGSSINVSSDETIHGIYVSDVLGRTEFHTSSVFTTQLQGLLIVRIMSTSGEKTMKMIVE